MKYGHVGNGKEVELNRYLEMNPNTDYVDVLNETQRMPGVKKKSISFNSIEKIDKATYYKGLKKNEESFYFQNLMGNHS